MKHLTRILKACSILILLLPFSMQVHADKATKKVIMVLSSYGEQQGEKKPGYEFDEFAKAYLVFKANGITVDIASPTGGAVEADKYDPNKPYNAKVLADTAIMKKLHNTIPTAQLIVDDYDAIFVVGGKGAMFDLPKDKALQSFIAQIYQHQGSVAAVCHGPAALVDVKLSDGRYLIANKAINGFTNKEEKLFGQKWLPEFEFMLQDKLTERGAMFQSSDIMLSHVAVDERLITGQNPTSTVEVANALVSSIGLTPVENTPDIDDKTLALVADFLAGDTTVLEILKQHQSDYNIGLVGMYGFYYVKLANTQAQHNHALSLMRAAQQALKNPTLDMQIAKTQQHLGQPVAAKQTLDLLLEAKPDYKPALDMLKTL
ncbi:type 1 glutamine amidotransferase domain-containing protein [Thalassotalea atypica]|uniref:type 1 glutamine amidotransferase domain-containing protein n=1 Tax=Thalassotalea atypica TaxID=2054316 RepID=UPI0025737198|nr:type 1 glutamine amidotransferase domain-containing protein [Thalassotalea atypica]